jgi:hypothetical protein
MLGTSAFSVRTEFSVGTGSQGVNQLLHGRLGVGLQFLEKLWRIEILKGRRQPL